MKQSIVKGMIFSALTMVSQYSFSDQPAIPGDDTTALLNRNQQISSHLQQQIEARLQYDLVVLSQHNEAIRLASGQDSDSGFVRPSLLPTIAAK